MVNIPAYCDNCKRWTPSDFEFNNVQELKLSNNTVPCRHCHRNGARVIDGTFNIIGGVLEIFESNGLTPKELKQLTHILRQAIERNTPAGKLREIIAEEVPRAAGLNKFIDDKRGLIAILMLLLQVLAIAMPYIKSPSNNDDLNTEKITNAILSQKPKEEPIPQVSRKVGVNDLCWCGSGKKRKKCHSLQSRPNLPRNLNQKPK
jgi:hypothetical protein